MSLINEDIQESYKSHNILQETIINELKKIVSESNSLLEGNSFYIHNTLNLHPELYNKQLNLFWSGKQASSRICEIGFNAGHSTMLMLLNSNVPLDYTVFDIGHHTYTKPCLKYIESKFPNVKFEYIEGDSTITMPTFIKNNLKLINMYDVVHVDGGHSEVCIINDMKNADMLVRLNGILIIDDTNMDHVNKYVDMYLTSENYKELNVLKTSGYPHRILQKIR